MNPVFVEMDKSRTLVQNGHGPKRHSAGKMAPPPPPKPSYAKSANSRNGEQRYGSDPVMTPPPPPLPTTSSPSADARYENSGSSGGSRTSGRENGRFDHTQEHRKKQATVSQEEMLYSILSSEDEEKKSQKSDVRPTRIGTGGQRLTPKNSKGSSESPYARNEKSDEKIKVSGDKEEDDDADSEACDCCLSPKELFLLKMKPFCGKIKPCCQTLFSNLLGVLIGALVTFITLRMGLSSSTLLPVSITSYRPIENFVVSPISGIRSENPQPWITIDLSSLIIGVAQLDSSDDEGGGEFGLDSASIVLNVTHKQLDSDISDSLVTDNVTSAPLNEQTLRTHLVTFRVKRQVKELIPSALVNDNLAFDSSESNTPTLNRDDDLIFVFHEQIGHEDQFESFIPLVEHVQAKLTHVLLRHIIISPQQLLESLKYAKKLRVLELDQVQLLGYFDGRTQLPALTKFSLHVVNSTDKISTTAPIKTYLFFDVDGYWRIEKITSLGVDIELTFDGRKYLGIDHSKGQLTSQLLMTNTILEHFYMNDRVFRLRNLALSFVELNIDLVSPALEHLALSSVTFKYGQTLEELLHKLNTLKSLELNNITSSMLKVSDLPSKSLSHLAFGRCSLHYSPDALLNLQSLYLDNVEGDEQFFLKFNFLFNVTRIAVSGLPASIQPHTFLKKILQMSAVQWIYMENFDRTEPASGNKTGQSDFTEIEWFLISAGVPPTVEVFLLEKNATSGAWNGKGVTIEQHKHLWFDLFGMEKFWTRASVDILNGMKGQKYITYFLNKQKELDELATMEQ